MHEKGMSLVDEKITKQMTILNWGALYFAPLGHLV